MLIRQSLRKQFWRQWWPTPQQLTIRSLKTLTAFDKEDGLWTHADIPTPKRLPVFGTTLDIIAAGSNKR